MDLTQARNVLNRLCDDYDAVKNLRDAVRAAQGLEEQIGTLTASRERAQADYEEAIDAQRAAERERDARLAELAAQVKSTEDEAHERLNAAEAKAVQSEQEAARRIDHANNNAEAVIAALKLERTALERDLEQLRDEIEAAHAARKELAAKLGG